MTNLDLLEIQRIADAWRRPLRISRPALASRLGRYWSWSQPVKDGRLVLHGWSDGPLRLTLYRRERLAGPEARYDGRRWRGAGPTWGVGIELFRAKLREASLPWVADQVGPSDAELKTQAEEIPW